MLRYTVRVENAGVGAITELGIDDATPVFTRLDQPVGYPGTLSATLSGCSVAAPATTRTGVSAACEVAHDVLIE